jgi:hypothetical protein
VATVAIVTGSICVLGMLAGVRGKEAWGVPLFFAIMSAMAAVVTALLLYVVALRNTPRHVEVRGSSLRISTPHSFYPADLQSCKWRIGSANEDTYVGLFLCARICVIVTLDSGAKIALGYTNGTPEEWIALLCGVGGPSDNTC